MSIYETDLEVVEGVFTLGEILHTDILPLIPLRFHLNVPLKTLHRTCDCASFDTFSSEDQQDNISFYQSTNTWEDVRISNSETNEACILRCFYNYSSKVETLEILIYDLNVKFQRPKSKSSVQVLAHTLTIPESFLKRIRVRNESGELLGLE
jgi:hypothetical protein